MLMSIQFMNALCISGRSVDEVVIRPESPRPPVAGNRITVPIDAFSKLKIAPTKNAHPMTAQKMSIAQGTIEPLGEMTRNELTDVLKVSR